MLEALDRADEVRDGKLPADVRVEEVPLEKAEVREGAVEARNPEVDTRDLEFRSADGEERLVVTQTAPDGEDGASARSVPERVDEMDEAEETEPAVEPEKRLAERFFGQLREFIGFGDRGRPKAESSEEGAEAPLQGPPPRGAMDVSGRSPRAKASQARRTFRRGPSKSAASASAPSAASRSRRGSASPRRARSANRSR